MGRRVELPESLQESKREPPLRMSVRTFRIRPDGTLEPIGLTQINSGEGPAWIEAGQREPGALRPLFESLDIHPLAISACLDCVPASLVSTYGSSLLAALPLLSRWDREQRTHLWVLATPDRLVTVRNGDVPAVEHVIERYCDGMRLQYPTTSALVYQVLDHLIDDGLAATQSTRARLDVIETSIEEERFDDFADESTQLKRILTRLGGTIEEQLVCVSSLQAIDGVSFSSSALRDYFRDAFLHLEHASKAVDRQLSHLNAMYQKSQLQLQERTNSRLRLLTVVSTIFLPLTLIAGVYGMNFERMPELSWEYGYVAVLGAMLLIAVGMLIQFNRKGWFD